MPVGRTRSVALLGLAGSIVEVEADISSQLPAFVIVGLPDAALSQARDRVRSAATNAGCPLPQRRVTVNLSPASLPKQGSAFDLSKPRSLHISALGRQRGQLASVVTERDGANSERYAFVAPPPSVHLCRPR